MKKIIYLVVVLGVIFYIYQINFHKESLFFSIGNQKGEIFYVKEDFRIPEVTLNIEQNKKINNKRMQQILIKASRIQLDMNTLFHLSTYSSVVTQIDDLEELLILMRKYCKERIEVVLLEEQSELAEYANKKISILCQKYDIILLR